MKTKLAAILAAMITLGAGFALAPIAGADINDAASRPAVSGWTISWKDSGWYQVQTVDGARSVCDGGRSCDVNAKGFPAGTYQVINHSTGQKWTDIDVSGKSITGDSATGGQFDAINDLTSSTSYLKSPNLHSANYFYTQAVASGNIPTRPPRGVNVRWDSIQDYADGVKIYRNNVLQTTITNSSHWDDPEGRPGSFYNAVAFRGDDQSLRSKTISATVEWFRELDYSEAEARIRSRLYSNHLDEASKEQVIKAAAAAFGGRPDLISKWHSDAGGEVHYSAAGYGGCKTAISDATLELPNNPSAQLVVHELAHIIDCSASGRLLGDAQLDGIGKGMTAWDETDFKAERDRLFKLNRDGERPTWLREYSFTNRGEFFSDVSSYFITDEWRRTRMAVEAPKLYDALRGYYYRPHWAPADEIALIQNQRETLNTGSDDGQR